MPEIKYAYLEELAVRLTDQANNHEAWLFNEVKHRWQEMHPADAMTKAKLVTKTVFEIMYPDLPPLPAEAFKT
jgi:hypothetical protein